MSTESLTPRWGALAPWPSRLAASLPAGLVPEICGDPTAGLARDDLDGLLLDAALAPALAGQLSQARGRGPLVLALGPDDQLGAALAAGADAVARADDPLLAWHLARLAERTRLGRHRHRLRGQLALVLGRAELLQDAAGADAALASRAEAVVEAALGLRLVLDAWPRLDP